MASTLSRTRDRIESDLEDQVARLTREVTQLRKAARKKGASAYSETADAMSEIYDELWDRVSDALPIFRRQAKRVNRAASDNPVLVAVVGVAVVGLAASLLLRR